MHAAVTVSFEESMRGVERQVVVTRQDVCDACRGAGHDADARRALRAVPRHRQRALGARPHGVHQELRARASGTGRQRSERCAVCVGQGRSVRTEAVPVHVPAGRRTKARGCASRSAATPGGTAARNGDLYVTVHVQPHPVFRRQGDDLHMVMPIGVHEAVLGARIDVPSLEGPVRLRIPPGTQAGQRFRLRERGVPRPAAAAAICWWKSRSCCPPSWTSARDLMRELGKLMEMA